MCFSPEMDALAGTVITIVGIDTVRRVPERRYLPLAALPVVFGVHQLIETLVWLRLQGRVGAEFGDPATTVYALMAFVLVPMLAPFAFLSADLVRWRGVAYLGVVFGVLAGGLGLMGAARAPITSCISGHHIVYDGHIPYGTAMVGLYVAAACLPPILARDRSLQVFGVVNLGAVAALIWIAESGLTSLWCIWAAITSVIINRYLRRTPGTGEAVPAGLQPHDAACA